MYIGIDLGGTNVAIGCVDEKGNILAKKSFPTESKRGYKAIVKEMADTIHDVMSDIGLNAEDIKAIGIGSPGTVDRENGVVVFAGNLDMVKVPMADELGKYFNVPINMENDANAAAYGEYIVCGHDADSFLLVTLGTGVGGGIILNKKIYRGFNNAGAEVGHITVMMDGEQCTCGKKGCYECYASVTALKKQTEDMIKKCPETMMSEWVKEHGHISGRTAFECADKGDKAAIEVRDNYLKYVAEGITSLMNIFQPEIIVIGGGISKEGDTLLNPVKEFCYKNDFNKFMPKTKIQIAKLFNDAGIVGAAMAAKM